jgi:hypothetical protein
VPLSVDKKEMRLLLPDPGPAAKAAASIRSEAEVEGVLWCLNLQQKQQPSIRSRLNGGRAAV